MSLIDIEIFDCEQSSDEWFRVRLGIPTASEFHTVLAKGRDGGASVTRKAYMLKLAGEIITGEVMENYTNANMERGKMMEAEARDLYAFLQDEPLARIGFVRNGQKGCSPDSFVGERGMLEIKTKQPNVLIDAMLRGNFPAEHVAQCQGGLWVAEREWIDVACYWPKMPLYTVRAYRDEKYIENLSRAVSEFNEELSYVVSRVRAYQPQIASAA